MHAEVTAVIPARDAAATLETCLDSLLVILVRPGSGAARIGGVEAGSRAGRAGIAPCGGSPTGPLA